MSLLNRGDHMGRFYYIYIHLKNALTTKLTNYLILSVLTFVGVHLKDKFPVELSAMNPATG